MKIALLILGGLAAALVLAIATSVILVRFADGPKGPLPGGALVSGELADARTADWEQLLGSAPVTEIELQLENPVGSRTTGAFVHDGALYVPCDLGYVWRRLPSGIGRLILHTIWLFKDWHENAARDGRVVVRVAGKRYELSAVRVMDEALLSQLRKRVTAAAGTVFELLPLETDPNEIWFFRLDPR